MQVRSAELEAGFATTTDGDGSERRDRQLRLAEALKTNGIFVAQMRAEDGGEQSEAMDYFKRALSIVEAELGVDHPKVMLHLSVMANNLLLSGKFVDAQGAMELAVRCLELCEGHHDELLHTSSSVEQTRAKFLLQSYAETDLLPAGVLNAETSASSSAGLQEHLHRDHGDCAGTSTAFAMALAQVYETVSTCQAAVGKLRDAVSSRRAVVHWTDAALGDAHMMSALARINLADTINTADARDTFEAISLKCKAMDVLSSSTAQIPVTHLDAVMSSLVSSLVLMERVDDAMHVATRHAQSLREQLGDHHPAVGSALVMKASVVAAKANPESTKPETKVQLAEEQLEVLIQASRTALSELPRARISYKADMLECYCGLQRWQEAYDVALDIRQEIRNVPADQLRAVVGNVITSKRLNFESLGAVYMMRLLRPVTWIVTAKNQPSKTVLRAMFIGTLIIPGAFTLLTAGTAFEFCRVTRKVFGILSLQFAKVFIDTIFLFVYCFLGPAFWILFLDLALGIGVTMQAVEVGAIIMIVFCLTLIPVHVMIEMRGEFIDCGLTGTLAYRARKLTRDIRS